MDKALIKNKFLAAFLIFVVSVLIYLPSMNNDFVWDDVIEIQKEYHKFKNKSFFNSLIPRTSKNKTKSYYRPLTFFSLYYDFNLWKNNPVGFHLTNILVNAFSSVLIYFLYLLVLKKFKIDARENIALFSALLFTVHPMHVESVSWIAGRTDVLCSMFFLAAFIAHIKSYEKWLYIIFTCLLFYLSLLSKELAAAFPFSILAYELISNKRLKKDSLLRLSAYFAFLIVYLLLRHKHGGVIVPDLNNDFISGGGSSSSAGQGIGLIKYISVVKTLFITYLFYFYKLITPFWFSSFISEYPKNVAMLLFSIVSFIVLAYVFIISYIKKSGFKAFCIFWLLLVLGPSVVIAVSKIATTPVAERYLYLPIAPFSLLVVFLFFKLREYRKMEQTALIVMVLVIIIFAFFTILRQGIWQDRISFWSDASNNTKSAIPHINLGMAYIDNDMLDEGIKILETSLSSNLRTSSLMSAISYNNLGIAYLKKGKTAKAKQIFLDAVEANPRFYKSYYHLGIIYLSYGMKKHSSTEVETAREYLITAIKYKKTYARAYLGLAKVYIERGEIGRAKELARIALKYGLIAPMDQQALFILKLN